MRFGPLQHIPARPRYPGPPASGPSRLDVQPAWPHVTRRRPRPGCHPCGFYRSPLGPIYRRSLPKRRCQPWVMHRRLICRSMLRYPPLRLPGLVGAILTPTALVGLHPSQFFSCPPVADRYRSPSPPVVDQASAPAPYSRRGTGRGYRTCLFSLVAHRGRSRDARRRLLGFGLLRAVRAAFGLVAESADAALGFSSCRFAGTDISARAGRPEYRQTHQSLRLLPVSIRS